MSSLSAEEKETNKQLAKDNWNNPVMLALLLFKENPYMLRCNETLYIYNGKHYDLASSEDIDAIFLRFCIDNEIPKSWKFVTSVVRALMAYSGIPTIQNMNDYHGLICLNNGILNVFTKEFVPHSPDYYFDSCSDVDYDPEAVDCPNFKQYLSSTFSNDKDTIENVIRIGGYLLDSSTKAQKMFLFDGQGSNGKSVLLDIYSSFFSHNNVSALSLEKLASPGFNKELLLKSRINVSAEQKKGNLDAEEIKAIVSGDLITVERKYQISVSFRPNVKILANSNGMPTFSDKSHAIYRRMLMIKFNNCFMSSQDYKQIPNPESKHIYLKDENLFDKIKQERTAILNLFIEGLIALKNDNYQFIENEASYASMSAYKRDSDTAREFLEDNYEACIGTSEKTSIQEVYEQYRYWYSRNVSATGLKFRSNEMGKKVADVFGLEPVGRGYRYNSEIGRSEKVTYYSIRPIPEPSIIDGEILTEEQAGQQGINF